MGNTLYESVGDVTYKMKSVNKVQFLAKAIYILLAMMPLVEAWIQLFISSYDKIASLIRFSKHYGRQFI